MKYLKFIFWVKIETWLRNTSTSAILLKNDNFPRSGYGQFLANIQKLQITLLAFLANLFIIAENFEQSNEIQC